MKPKQPEVVLVTTPSDADEAYTTGIYINGTLELTVRKVSPDVPGEDWYSDVVHTLRRLGIEYKHHDTEPETLPYYLSEIEEPAPDFEIDEDDPEDFLALPVPDSTVINWVPKSYAKHLRKFLNTNMEED